MIHTLENETWRLDVVPEAGASVVGLWARLGGGLEPVMRPTPPEAIEAGAVSRFSSFTLAPYSNRVRGARFAFEGREYRLRPTTPEGHSQHGDVRTRPWRVTASGPAHLECAFRSRDFADVNFPFPFAVAVAYRLWGPVCETRLALTNEGDEPMPAGIGLHPYFVRRLGGSPDVRLGFSAGGVYVTDEGLIPDGPMVAVPPELDFSRPRSPEGQALNHGFGDWDGHASLEWPGVARLSTEAEAAYTHLVVYTPPDGSLAVEPVSHATDGFNLVARGVGGTGVTVLDPGETMAGSVRLRLEVLG